MTIKKKFVLLIFVTFTRSPPLFLKRFVQQLLVYMIDLYRSGALLTINWHFQMIRMKKKSE
jgi:hypothetical protein